MRKLPQIEELTTAMHSEFTVSEETDIKHRCWTAWECIEDGDFSFDKACQVYNVTKEKMLIYTLSSI